MKATPGDHLVMPGKHVGDGDRTGDVIEVRGADGGPPYLVRWSDGHEGIVYPGPEVRLTHASTPDGG